ncbi:ABC transporter ATP-binding protein [Nocardiopsis tropica]|uniref:ABC transporter ATP-binding protein n=1 Tax=Nocardiopsis tropica TaxID=109330 RepID=A0ABU7KW27_9ACTN|nr:ABC transporter ATP-binding protein [Nocardiopsis umidischolae]MEE2053511.1 ABC transporter ATP-binding protein [Nocardiopsis umidischolae]
MPAPFRTPTRTAPGGRPPAPGAVGGPAGAAVALTAVHRSYTDGDGRVSALDGVTLRVPRGTFLAVMGPSGSGKSTLLNCASGLDRVTSGTVEIGGRDISGLREPDLTVFRRDHVGFVFQSYNLVPTLTAEDNITLPLRLAGVRPDAAWIDELVRRVGVADRLGHRPPELSGGQQQRVAIVRALAARPDIVFADEPTGALDGATADRTLSLLRGIVDDLGQTVVMVTHDPAAAARAHDTAVMASGRVVDLLHAPAAADLAGRLASLGTVR